MPSEDSARGVVPDHSGIPLDAALVEDFFCSMRKATLFHSNKDCCKAILPMTRQVPERESRLQIKSRNFGSCYAPSVQSGDACSAGSVRSDDSSPRPIPFSKQIQEAKASECISCERYHADVEYSIVNNWKSSRIRPCERYHADVEYSIVNNCKSSRIRLPNEIDDLP